MTQQNTPSSLAPSSAPQRCGNTDALIGYLYDEIAPAERTAFSAHLATCARCADELAALRGTRYELAQWAPPEAQLGFRIVSDAAAGAASDVASGFSRKDGNILRPARWWQQPLPAWAQAAAAAVIFTAGLGLGALRGTSTPGGASDGAPAIATNQAQPAVAPVSVQDLAALENRLRAELQPARPAAAGARVAETVPAPVVASGPTLQQVRQMIADSEQRQQRELTLRTAEVIRDFDTQRRGDLTRIQQTLGRIEGSTGVEIDQLRRQQDMLMRVSQRPQ